VAREKILVVDDEEAIRDVVATLLETEGYRCTLVGDGGEALKEFTADSHDLVLSDIIMPGMDGLKLLKKMHARNPDVPVIMVTAMHDISAAIEAIRIGAYDYLLKPFDKDQLFLSVRRALEHRRLLLENRIYQRNLEQLVADRTDQLSLALQNLEKSYDYTLDALGGALDLKDAETEGHCQRVTAYTITIAKAMNVEPASLRHIARGAFLHDIGKMGVPDSILRKPGPLTSEEQMIIRRHCEIGYQVLDGIPFLHEAAQIVLAHQERYDGTGYPRGLKGEQIPIGARIFAIADSLDAITSDRPYRKAASFACAREEVRRGAGTQFDPKVVAIFLSIPEDTWEQMRSNMKDPFRLTKI
jgi:cyclic di-GMP phosphodiesterase